jgi:hypothetical protein
MLPADLAKLNFVENGLTISSFKTNQSLQNRGDIEVALQINPLAQAKLVRV